MLRLSVRALALSLLLAFVGLVFALAAVRDVAEYQERGVVARVLHDIAAFPRLAGIAIGEVDRMIRDREGDWHFRVDPYRGDATGFSVLDPEFPALTVRGTPATPGWTLVGGAFAGPEGAGSYALVLSPEGEIVSARHLTQDIFGTGDPRILSGTPTARLSPNILVHGLVMDGDGALYFVFDNGESLQKVDTCGEVVWARQESFHHGLDLGDDGRLYTLRFGGFTDLHPFLHLEGDSGAVVLDPADGALVDAVSVADLFRANPEVSVFDLPRFDVDVPEENQVSIRPIMVLDAWHENDIEVLDADMAAAFPMFEAGDLLWSFRTLNLVFVSDPETDEIKWFDMGRVNRQHDPDFRPDGTISVFDNRMGRGRSDIVAFDPATGTRSVLFDGARDGFYTSIRGKHDWRSDGGMVLTSPQQGRLIELGPDGTIERELRSTSADGAWTYPIMAAKWWPADAFDAADFACPAPG